MRMSAGFESSSRRADAGAVALAVAVGVALLTLAWGLLHVGFYDRNQIVDTPVYQEYGEAMTDGRVPYRDFELEYPPAALPVFLLPALVDGDDYGTTFELLMWACAAAAVVFVGLAAAASGASPGRVMGSVAFVALAPLALGSVILTRFDFWPAALVAAALAALLAGRDRLGCGVLALAAVAKVYGLVLLPLALLWTARRRGGREALVSAGVFLAVLAVVVLPFAVISPGGLADSVERQLERPLQIETLSSAALLAAHQLGAYDPTVVSSSGSQNLAGSLPDALAAVQTALQALAVAVVWLLFAVGPRDRRSFAAASAAAVTAFVVLGKVLSPQFLIWLIPLVPLVVGTAGAVAASLLAVALVTTQLWFPYRYWDVVALAPTGWLVFARDLVLVGLFAVLVVAMTRRREAPRTR
jgi:hypothetical protein